MPKGVYQRTPANKPKPRTYPEHIIEAVCRMYLDEGMTVSEVQEALPKGFKAQRIIERHIPERRAAAKRDQGGAKNHAWKAAPGYQAAHLRIAAALGAARDHVCADCGQRAQEWSYRYTDPEPIIDRRGRVYSLDPGHYEPRCVTCHRRHDARKRTEEVMPHVS